MTVWWKYLDGVSIPLGPEFVGGDGYVRPMALQELLLIARERNGTFCSLHNAGRFFEDRRHCVSLVATQPRVELEEITSYEIIVPLLFLGDRGQHLVIKAAFVLKSVGASADTGALLGELTAIVACKNAQGRPQSISDGVMYAGPAWAPYISEGLAMPKEEPAWAEVASFVVPSEHADRQGFLLVAKYGVYIWDALHEVQQQASATRALLDIEFRRDVRVGDTLLVMLWRPQTSKVRACVLLTSRGKICTAARLSFGTELAPPARL